MSLGKLCQGCNNRKVGCHSTCQPYVVAKVIHSYKREKSMRERELKFNYEHYETVQKGNKRKMKGFKRKSSF